jgi:PDZ domain-containing secreted protein
VLALNSAGTTESQGLVGLVGGVLLWVAAAQQAGLADELRERIRR